MKTIVLYFILLGLLVVARISRAQSCPTAVVVAVGCAVPAGTAPLPFDAAGNAFVAGGTYYYGGTQSLNLFLSGGTVYYASSATSNITQSGGTLVYTYGSSAAPGTLTNYTQSGGVFQVCGGLNLTANVSGGSLVVAAGASVRFPSTHTLQSGAQLTNNGTATFASDLGINSSATGVLVNAGTLAVSGTLFLRGPGFVNQGTATVGTLVVSSSGTACLAPGSKLNATTFQTNDQPNSLTVLPAGAGPACVRITNPNLNGFNQVLTATSQVGICRAGGGMSAQEGAKYGAATLTQNCSSCQTVLPVVLVSFGAQAPAAPGGPVQVRWVTASEVNHQGFVVERSADGRAFEARSALLPGAGSSLLGGAYLWADADPLPGTSYYRLRLLEADGRAEYSPTVAAHAAAPAEAWAWAYPPDADHLRLDWLASAAPAAPLTWQLLDVQGRRVRQHSPPAAAGTATLELAGLPPGAYWLHVQQGSRRQLLRVARP